MTTWLNVATSYYSIKHSEQLESLEKTMNVSSLHLCIIFNFMAKLINAHDTIEANSVILQFTGGFVQKNRQRYSSELEMENILSCKTCLQKTLLYYSSLYWKKGIQRLPSHSFKVISNTSFIILLHQTNISSAGTVVQFYGTKHCQL